MKYKNKYRIESSRLKNWDYTNNGAYFITICSNNREHFFGEIVLDNDVNYMNLSEIGILAQKFWIEIPNHFAFVELGNFVIMPNHIHGILIINNKNNIVEPLQNKDLTDKDLYFAKISPKSGSISAIIRSYKSIVSR